MGEEGESKLLNSKPEPEPEEANETDKMLGDKSEDNTETGANIEKCIPVTVIGAEELKTPTNNKKEQQQSINEKKKTNGEEIVKVAETEATRATVTQEGREVKPKKIPIGGIKMPGFFTKGKLRGEGDGSDGELLEKEDHENKANEEKPKQDKKAPTIGERIRNFFNKKQQPPIPPPPPPPAIRSEDTNDVKNESSGARPSGDDRPPKKGLLNAIKLPIANIIPKKKFEHGDDVELGNATATKAGLASMETLDDSLKDQDTVDRARVQEEGVLTAKTNDEKKAQAGVDNDVEKNGSCCDRIRAYKCSIDDLAIVGGILIFVILVAIICVFTFIGGDPQAPVRDGRYVLAVTSCGMVEGILEDGAFAFRGVPYAVPPTDENRWRPAQSLDNINSCWNDTFKAHNATEFCSQVLSNGTKVGIEDCLTLDVITPHVRYDNPLPVIVLIGAESLMGGAPGLLRPSTRYARSKDTLFVRPNFRMGPLGFLALDALSKSTYPPTSGNYALSDILAALNWIKANIVHFGGDANSVTLFGHRAGATLLTALVTSPKSKGLYARAWLSSGAAVFPGKTLAESERLNQIYINRMECSDDVDCLRNSSVEKIIDTVPDVWRRDIPDLPAPDENSTLRHEWLVLDGDILQQHPNDVWNRENDIPKLIIGTTAHESHSEKLYSKYSEWTPEIVRKHIEQSKIGSLGLTEEAIKRYNATYQGLISMISDIRTICPLLAMAKLQPSVTFYVVTQTSDLSLADVNADIQAILGRYKSDTPELRQYLASIQQIFYHFVSHGEMKQFESRRRIINLARDALPMDDYPNCDFWISQDIVPRYARID